MFSPRLGTISKQNQIKTNQVLDQIIIQKILFSNSSFPTLFRPKKRSGFEKPAFHGKMWA